MQSTTGEMISGRASREPLRSLRLFFLSALLGCGAYAPGHELGDPVEGRGAHRNPYLGGVELPLPETESVSLVWPSPNARVRPLAGVAPPRALRVLIDPGHGAPGNTGNVSCRCADEQDTMLALGRELALHLLARGYEVKLTREAAAIRPRYQARVQVGLAWRGDVLISLHSDIRGWPRWWRPDGRIRCLFRDVAPGFAILYADNGPAGRLDRREQLARLLARRLDDAGFLPYDGWDYEGIYEADALVPGTFIDRHLPGGRIYMLRHPPMPSVIIETYNARHRVEDARFAMQETREAFFAAVAAALSEFAAIRFRARDRARVRARRQRSRSLQLGPVMIQARPTRDRI